MNDSLLIFTFSPIQSFIAEARRAQDLFMGSRILARLAEAAGNVIEERYLVYPADLGYDTPNMLVACIPEEQTNTIITNVKKAMETVWEKYVDNAHQSMLDLDVPIDDVWEKIWKRQTKPFWQIYWAVAPIKNDDYKTAYITARDTLDAVKRSRLFEGGEPEEGRKDSLSGKRAALHTKAYPDARKYWSAVTDPKTTKIYASKVRPFGREMLDAIGAVKRFATNESFLSTSSIASASYLSRIKDNAQNLLTGYRDKLWEHFAGDNKIFEPREESEPDWPFDGDLLYVETLTSKRLKDDYGVVTDKDSLAACHKELKKIYQAPLLDNPKEKIGAPPKYYAILVLDGDNMGRHIDDLLNRDHPKDRHKDFSAKVSQFSKQVPSFVTHDFLIYNGGDDVLSMLSLADVVPSAQKLAELFNKLTGNAASAGIAFVHHQSPLDAALEAARQAEKVAKQVAGKNAICIRALKRSGETLEVCSKWANVRDNFDELVKMYKKEVLSSRFAYDAKRSAYAMSGDKDMWQAELKRLLLRHGIEMEETAMGWSRRLSQWTTSLPGKAEGLANWLILARFIAQGGGE